MSNITKENGENSKEIKENSLNNGHAIEVTPDMFARAANDFSEGNEYLKKLLTFCFENDIKTTGCCAGHKGKQEPYIQFEFNDKNIQAILKMLKQLSVGEIIYFLKFIKKPGITSKFTIYIQNDKANEGFKQILDALQYQNEVDINKIDPIRKLIVNSLQNHNIENSYMEFHEDKDDISIAVDVNDYIVFDYKHEEPKSWIENTDLMTYPKKSKELKRSLKRLKNKTKKGKLQSNKKSKIESNKIVIDDMAYDILKELIQSYDDDELKMQKENGIITAQEIKDATEAVKISDINNATEEIKQEVAKERQTVELDSKDVEQGM